MRTVFLDRDGVINENSSDHIKSWEEFAFLPNVLMALRWLRLAGFRVFIVTNQAIVNRGLISRASLEEIHARMIARVELSGGRISAVRYCPHDYHENCSCRKPRPGMLLDLARQWKIDLKRTYMVGDALTDVAAGQSVGCRSALVLTGRGSQQVRLSEINVHRPDYIATDLFGAVQWIFRQEGVSLIPAAAEIERAVGQREVQHPSQPTLVTSGV